MPNSPERPADDPLGLESVDREIRIEKLRREIDEVAGGEMISGKIANCDPKVEEVFLANVLKRCDQLAAAEMAKIRKAHSREQLDALRDQFIASRGPSQDLGNLL